MKTLKELSDESWEKFEKEGTTKINVGQCKHMGKGSKTFQVSGFTVMAGCNVYHWDDVARCLYNNEMYFTLSHWNIEGRDRFWQIEMDKHMIHLHASGYGQGDWIVFSKGFPENIIFNILITLARRHTFDMIKYHESNLKKTKGMKVILIQGDENANRGMINLTALKDIYWDRVKNIQELKDLATFHHLESNIPCLISLINCEPSEVVTKENQESYKKQLVKAKEQFKKFKSKPIIKNLLKERKKLSVNKVKKK